VSVSRYEGLILAAGRGSRMGAIKPLLRQGEASFLERVAGCLADSRALSRVTVVLGAHAETVGQEAARLGLRTVINSAFESGLLSSLQAGIRSLGPDCTAVMVALADQPLIQPGTLRELCVAFSTAVSPGDSGAQSAQSKQERATLARPVFNGRAGHPCLIAREHFAEIVAQPPSDRGAAFLFEKYPARALLHPVADAGIHRDFDVPSDLERIFP
jgi:nicotine blue oxidoreductase